MQGSSNCWLNCLKFCPSSAPAKWVSSLITEFAGFYSEAITRNRGGVENVSTSMDYRPRNLVLHEDRTSRRKAMKLAASSCPDSCSFSSEINCFRGNKSAAWLFYYVDVSGADLKP